MGSVVHFELSEDGIEYSPFNNALLLISSNQLGVTRVIAYAKKVQSVRRPIPFQSLQLFLYIFTTMKSDPRVGWNVFYTSVKIVFLGQMPRAHPWRLDRAHLNVTLTTHT